MKYGPMTAGQCPHCRYAVKFIEVKATVFGSRSEDFDALHKVSFRASGSRASARSLDITASQCPNCGELVATVDSQSAASGSWRSVCDPYLAWPRAMARRVPQEVPEHIAQDYREAVLIAPMSPKASAALLRRCLQAVLKEAGKAEGHTLYDQIQKVLPQLPSYIADDLDAIRQFGNFAAHPSRYRSTGEIVDIDSGEVEWSFEILDRLLDFYYVLPAKAKEKRQQLNAKRTR